MNAISPSRQFPENGPISRLSESNLLLPLAAFFLLDSVNPQEILAQIRRKFWLWSPICAAFGLLLALIVTVCEYDPALNLPLVVARGDGI